MKKLFLSIKLVINLFSVNFAFAQLDEQMTHKEVPQLGSIELESNVVKVGEDLVFYLPNAFTPNKDQFNEEFLPVFTSRYDPYDYTLYIFDRWGELLFESHDPTVGWNSTNGSDAISCQDGVYTWKIVYKQKMENHQKLMLGHVTLVR